LFSMLKGEEILSRSHYGKHRISQLFKTLAYLNEIVQKTKKRQNQEHKDVTKIFKILPN
jgi:hypothetical protein